MPKFKITWNFNGDERSEIVERDTLQEAEWAASDRLRDMIYARTSSNAEPIDVEYSD